MKKTAIIIIAILTLTACEIFEIGSKQKPVIILDQTTPVGTVMLFKIKLDSNKISDAAAVMRKNSGEPYLAIEKVELFEDLKRLGRIIAGRKITRHYTDTLTADFRVVNMEFDYIRNYKFNTRLIGDKWYVTGYKQF
jgi:hypothetical protein